MNVMFAHDHVFLTDNKGNYYSEGKLSYKVWERYLKDFDKVVVSARSKKIESHDLTNKYNISSGENVEFISLPTLSNPIMLVKNRGIVIKQLEAQMDKVDALIARLPSEIGALAIKIAMRKKKPWAVELVGCPWDSLWNHGSFLGKLYAPISATRTKLLVRQSPYVLYVTREFLQKRYPTKGKTTSCSNVEILPVEDKIIVNRINKIMSKSNKIVIGVIASLNSDYKGIDTALKATSIISKLKSHSIELRILGGGNPSKWKKMAFDFDVTKQTVFQGTLPGGDAVLEWLDQIDIYIQPSKTEGLPRALIEAMSRGCPAIGSEAGGIPELLNNSFIHKVNDFNKLAQLIVELLTDSNKQIECARNNLKESEKYSVRELSVVRSKFWKEFSEFASSKDMLITKN